MTPVDLVTIPRADLDALRAELISVRAENAKLREEIAALKERVNRTSKNSSRPPSSDGLTKPRVQSERRPSGRSPGKQPGSSGAHLASVAEPDHIVIHRPDRCAGCGGSLERAAVEGVITRQVMDLPPIRLVTTEHQAEQRRCRCGVLTAAGFPEGVGAPVQYGPGVRALIVYLGVYQHLPVDRVAQLLSHGFNSRVSTGTVAATISACAGRLDEFTAAVREQLSTAPVAHFDETGGRIAGRLQWIHSASTNGLTLYTAHEKRGQKAMDDAGVLPAFGGTAVHDGFTPYRNYAAQHGLCNAHHLRELRGVAEQSGQAWASQMRGLLVEIKDAVEHAIDAGRSSLPRTVWRGYQERYEAVIAAGRAVNPPPVPTGMRGHPARSTAGNLLLRMDQRRDEVLRFATDFRVPFDNNLAERDIRMVKLQQKISGSWRTTSGARSFCAIRSYISTLRKQNQDVLAELRRVFLNDRWLPADGRATPAVIRRRHEPSPSDPARRAHRASSTSRSRRASGSPPPGAYRAHHPRRPRRHPPAHRSGHPAASLATG